MTNEATGGFFVDVGAHDGFEISNTYLLEKRYSWRGVCIEANPNSYSKLKRNRSCICLNYCIAESSRVVDFRLDGKVGGIVPDGEEMPGSVDQNARQTIKIETRRLSDVLHEISAPALIDYLSIDVEGAEERLFDGLDLYQWKFRCMTIERPNRKIMALLDARGYEVVKHHPSLDTFLVHRDYLEDYLHNSVAFYTKRLKIKRNRYA